MNEQVHVRKKRETKVEIAGVAVSQALIDSVVKATSDAETVQQIEERERTRTRKIISDSELRADIDVSKQITSALIEQAGKPEPRRIDVDSLPPLLKRAVIAYVSMCESREEYSDAVKELAAKAHVDTMPVEVVAACKAIDINPERLVAGLGCIDPRDV